MVTLREEQAKLDEIDRLFDKIEELDESLAAMGRQLGRGAIQKGLTLIAKMMKKRTPMDKVDFIVNQLLPAVGLEAEELLQHVGRLKSAAGGAAKAGAAAPEAAPEADPAALPPGSRY
jgi:hypothetical protein